MKVLFLDVDGVLNSAEWFAKQEPTKPLRLHEIDPKPVKRVLRVLEETGAKIVLSSTWRLVPELVERLRAVGLPIWDVTPSSDSGHRATEIRTWLATRLGTRFAIIDDDADAGEGDDLRPYFVRTHWKHGMYGKHEKALLAILNGEEPKR